jgi:polyhydroxyalkanoate synthesis regulator phasin
LLSFQEKGMKMRIKLNAEESKRFIESLLPGLIRIAKEDLAEKRKQEEIEIKNHRVPTYAPE